MKTCVNMNCPFIPYCKNYNFAVDRGDMCVTRENIMRAAQEAYNAMRRDLEGRTTRQVHELQEKEDGN